MASQKIQELLGDQASFYLDHKCTTIDKSALHTPSANAVDNVWIPSNRNIQTVRSIQALMGNGRLANTGYVSILPVDQGIEEFVILFHFDARKTKNTHLASTQS